MLVLLADLINHTSKQYYIITLFTLHSIFFLKFYALNFKNKLFEFSSGAFQKKYFVKIFYIIFKKLAPALLFYNSEMFYFKMSDVIFSMLNIKIWIEANRFSIIC